jgi:competence ComEA-like helix-hairpin-helix protein
MALVAALAWLATTSAEVEAAVVDINQADVATLCSLPGIGPRKAEAIVALRERRPLTRVTQLLQVKGIGPKLLERLRGRIALRPALAPTPSGGGPQMQMRNRPGANPDP